MLFSGSYPVTIKIPLQPRSFSEFFRLRIRSSLLAYGRPHSCFLAWPLIRLNFSAFVVTHRMSVIGITGGIGMGKSTVTDWLAETGMAVVDCDVIARELTAAGGDAIGEIVEAFGPTVLDADGALSRARMADIVFRNQECRERLEAILHPRIRIAWKARCRSYRSPGSGPVFVAIPLLYETGASEEFDLIACVACGAVEQRSRLRARGWSDEHIQRRLGAQWNIDRKMRLADIIVWTGCSLKMAKRQVRCLIQTAERLALQSRFVCGKGDIRRA
ncbi:MAG: Dephospho-CoA kinase [Verrucomicrobia subdivision 3 bacterium]|nr:Dephospho-CoA kinase [Limisphaerales bacterium]MCS1413836.1 Dephospho-CoA kinase [Limisphaerales bacterium]